MSDPRHELLFRAELCFEYAAAFIALAHAYNDRANVETDIQHARLYLDVLKDQSDLAKARILLSRLDASREAAGLVALDDEPGTVVW